MSNQKGFAYPILIVGIILIIGFVVGGYYYFQQQKFKNTDFSENPEESQDTQEVSQEKSENSSSDGLSDIKWKNYNGNLIEFSYPENKPWDTYTSSPDTEPSFFDFNGSSGLVEMHISLYKIPEGTDFTFKGESSPKALINKSRDSKLKGKNENEAVKRSVTEIKETKVDGNIAYYYDFLGSYSGPINSGFVMEKGECLTRAIFVSTSKTVYEIVYCTEQPFEDIFKSIKLKK